MGCCCSTTAADPTNGKPFHDKNLTDEERERRRQERIAAAEQRDQASGPKTVQAKPAATDQGGMLKPSDFN